MTDRTLLGAPGRAVLLAAAVLATPAQAQMVCNDAGQDCKVVVPGRHAVTTLDYWRKSLARPVEQRIGTASPEVIDYTTQDNIKNDLPNRPRTPALAPEFMRDLRQAFDELPAAVKRLLVGKLAGVMLAEDIGGTGYTEEIVDAANSAVAAFTLLDSAVLSSQTANAWATWKENTPFKPNPGYELVAEIAARSDDNRKSAIQYILLHELGHVLSIGARIHPSWTIEPRDVQSAAEFPYFRLSWSLPRDGNSYATIFDARFPRRKDVRYYFGAKLEAEQMIEIYSALETTNLPTLYGATHPGDDWAEAFVTYVHTVMMNKPFAIRIYKDGKLAKEYRACWNEKRCEEKRKIIERMLGVN